MANVADPLLPSLRSVLPRGPSSSCERGRPAAGSTQADLWHPGRNAWLPNGRKDGLGYSHTYHIKFKAHQGKPAAIQWHWGDAHPCCSYHTGTGTLVHPI